MKKAKAIILRTIIVLTMFPYFIIAMLISLPFCTIKYIITGNDFNELMDETMGYFIEKYESILGEI